MVKVAIVTGGTRGIGAAIAKRLKETGHSVAATYHGNVEAAEKFKAETGVAIYRWDVADPAASVAGVRQVEADLGLVEVLVNNAGITKDGWFHKMDYAAWSAVLRTNLDSMFCMTRPVIEGMRDRGRGRIINISSINGQKGQIGQVNYSASKAGILGFTKALAQENARKGITVNAICPGYIDTDMVHGVPEKVLEGIIAQIPVGRLGKAEEIASMVAYLASDEAGFVTGAVMTVNGAQYLANG
jgi:acetoacetyl-CoA reductase